MTQDKQPLSPRASLAYTDQGQWVEIQRTTFRNWVNEQLRRAGVSIGELRTDFTDGVNLVTLVESLTGRSVPGVVRKPSNQYQKLQNITVALDTVAKDGVKIINIDSSDISEGNVKLILALVWLLVLRYQGGLGASQHRTWMLAWLQAVLPDCHITNLTKDWNDGVALHALLEFCKPGIAPDWRSLDKEDKLANCRRAMELAQQHFNIPLVLRPEDMCSPQLDDKSAILYLSYFTRVGGPGYNATRELIQDRLKSTRIINFTTDWNDGKALRELVTSCGGQVPDSPGAQPSATVVLQSALDAGRELGIEPLLTAAEIAGERSEHLGIMALTARYAGTHLDPAGHTWSRSGDSGHRYTSQNGGVEFTEKVTLYDDDANSTHTNASSLSAGGSASQATPTFQLVRKASIKSPPQRLAATNGPFGIDIYSVGVIMESKLTGRRFDPDQFKVEAEAPSGRVIRMVGDGHYSAQFTPDEIGRWRVSMYYNNKFMDGCPVDVCDPSQVRVRNLRGGHVGKQQSFQVDCTSAGQGDLGVDIAHNGKRVPTFLSETMTPRLFKVTYTPYDPGPYEVNVHFNRAEVRNADFHSTDPEERRRQAVFNTSVVEEGGVIKINASCDWEVDYVTGGPFIVHVTDSSDIQVYGMKDGTVCSNPELIADCTKVGDGVITAEVTHAGIRSTCKVRQQEKGLYRINFKPRGPGQYKIWINYDGAPVKGSPFIQDIAELGHPLAFGDGLYRGMPGRPQTFTVDPRGHPGPITADVAGPLQSVPCQLTPQNDGTLAGSYVPRETGPHTVDIRLEGKPIDGSPFKPYIVDPEKVRLAGGRSSLFNDKGVVPLHVNKEKLLPFDASDAGQGELSAEVRGPTGRIPVAIDARNDGKHTVIFTPREEGKHYIDVKWGGFPLVNSPFEGDATWTPEPVIYPETEIITLKQIPLQRSKPPMEDKDIIPLTVGQEKEMVFDLAQSGPGRLTAAVRGPSHKAVPVAVDDGIPDRHAVLFTPQEEGKHVIDVNWNGAPLSTSPYVGFATKDTSNGAYRPPPQVFLSGRQPSGPQKEEDKDIIPLTVKKEKQLPFDATRAGPGRLTATVRGPSHGVPAAVEDRGDGRPVLCFTPQEEGKHTMDVSWNGVPLAESPLLGFATRHPETNGYPGDAPPVYLMGHVPRDGHPMKGNKDILPLKVNQPKPLHFDATMAGPGELTASVRGPTRAVRVNVEDHRNGRPVVHFTPQEEGKHHIDVKWNNRPIPQSPLIGYAAPADRLPYNGLPPVYLAGYHPRGGKPYDHGKDIIPLKVNQPKQLPFDAMEAGPGKLTGAVRGPSRPVATSVEDRNNGKPTLHFVPEEEGKHLIDVEWNGQPISKSPFVGYATRDLQPLLISTGSSRSPSMHDVSFRSSLASLSPMTQVKDRALPLSERPRSRSPLKVILSGRGLKEAALDKPAVFHVDSTQASPGKPTAHLEGVKDQIPVHVEPVRPQVYRCTYVPKVPGAYKLYVNWNEHPLRGSPFKVNVPNDSKKARDKGMVFSQKDSATVRPGDDFELTVHHPVPNGNHENAGQLTVKVTDPRGHVIPCRFLDNLDGTRSLKMTPTMPGRHRVEIRHNDQHIMGSPYNVDISDSHVLGQVRVWGPGIQRGGVIGRFESNFWVDATGAGAGELKVRIMGPKGAFHVKMRKANQKDKLYQCFYDPVEAGVYTVHVQWSGTHVEGSPFTVCLANTPQELEMMVDDGRSSKLSPSSGLAGSGSLMGSSHHHEFLY